MRLRTSSRVAPCATFTSCESLLTVKLSLMGKVGNARVIACAKYPKSRMSESQARADSHTLQEANRTRFYLAGGPRSIQRDPGNGFHPVTRLRPTESRSVSTPGGFRPFQQYRIKNSVLPKTLYILRTGKLYDKRFVAILATNPPTYAPPCHGRIAGDAKMVRQVYNSPLEGEAKRGQRPSIRVKLARPAVQARHVDVEGAGAFVFALALR
jgi:hypothetical protein